jgi:lipopolysaccharide transport system permease protein
MLFNSQEILIEPNKTLRHIGRDIWQYRELFLFLAWRNLLVRYKQTVIGIVWALLQPLLTMAILTIVFSKIAKLPSYNIPYPILVYAALLPWQFFSNIISASSESLLADANLISKIYFPRIIVPTACLIVALTDLVISLGLFLILMVFFKIIPASTILWLPVFILLAGILSLGIGYFISALNIKYRDFRYIIPFIIQVGLYISPIGFSSFVVPEQWRGLYSLNPMVGVIEGFRWCLLGGQYPIDINSLLVSIAFSLAIFLLGLNYFISHERKFADII